MTPPSPPTPEPGRDLAPTPGSWPVLATEDLHRDGWVVALRRDTIHRPGHPDEPLRRLVVEHPGAVMVVALDERERICLLRQYRHAGRAVFSEVPAGLCDTAGEDPAETGRRELREEAELEATEWTHLLSSYPSVGITEERHHVYLARGLSRASRGDFALVGEEAELEVFWVPVDDVLDAVLDGTLEEGPLALAVLVYDARRRRGLLPPGPPDGDLAGLSG